MGILEEASPRCAKKAHEKLAKPVRCASIRALRWPLAVGRWPLAVGRWPLCAVAVAGSLMMCASEAHAGSWRIHVDISQSGSIAQYDPNSPAPMFGQTSTAKSATSYSKNAGTVCYDNNNSTGLNNNVSASGTNFSYVVSLSGYAQNGIPVSIDNTVNYTLRLHYVPDNPNDVPPQFVAVQLSGDTGGHYAPSPGGYTTTGTPSMTGATGLTDTTLPPTNERGVTIDINGNKVEVYPNSSRQADITLGPYKATGKAFLPNAYKTTTMYDRDGNSTGTSISYAQQDIAGIISFGGSLCSFSPDPNNLALDDGSTTLKGLNQYTIDQGIPTTITTGNTTATFLNYLKSNASWTVEGNAPALRPLLDNYISGSTVGPQHPALGSGTTPEKGLKFDVQLTNSPSQDSSVNWKFPASNSQFGEKTLKHKIGDAEVTAPVGLFYPGDGYQHPPGGPKGYSVYEDAAGNRTGEVEISTPNWFYYYYLGWTPPCDIVYWAKPSSAYYPGDSKVYVGSPAHSDGAGYGKRPLFETVSGAVTWVGFYQAYGIDNFAHVVTHEFNHKKNWETYHLSIAAAAANGISDTAIGADGKMLDPDADPDGDGLPSGFEESIGLKPLNPDSTGFTAGGWYGGDQEAFVRWKENQISTPDRSVDWASNGLNFGRTPGGRAADRIKRYKRDGVTILP
jgi:hypothetical protein